MGKALILVATLALAGCTTTGGTFCDIAKPIRPSQAALDAMDGQDVVAVLVHNKTGERLCGWTP
jgi:hypothetical protein